MDLCHLKNSELEPQYQKYKGRVVLRGDFVKDDSGSYAVFIEHGSSASQMTAAKVMDIISRLPRCAGHTADAVSAYTQVKMEDAPTLLIIPQSECPAIWIRLPKHKWPNSWEKIEGKSSKLGMLIRTPWKRSILICVCGRYQIVWKETKHKSDMENSHERRWFGRTTIIPRPCLFELHSKRMPDLQGYCG